jgi:hypothetical protein
MMPPNNFMEVMENTMATRLINHIRRTRAVLTTTAKVDSINSHPPRIQDDMEAENNEHQFNSYQQK